jgi:hypothetical protein
MADKSTPNEPKLSAQFEHAQREEDFSSLYANNVLFERSAWDFKMIFGELDQSITPNISRLHTAMTVPWLQAKLMAYYIELNLAIYEAEMGEVRIPDALMPATPLSYISEEDLKNNKVLAAHMRYFTAIWTRFFAKSRP